MKASSFCALLLSFLLLTTLSAISSIAQSSDLKADLQSSFTKVDVVRISSGSELRTVGDGKKLTVPAAGKSFELNVTLHDMRSPRYRAENTTVIGVTTMPSLPVNTFKGKIEGEPNSEVRLTIEGVKVEGFFEGAAGRLFIEPASKYSRFAEPGDSVIYRAEDS